jgi:adenylate cyclase 9
VRDQADWLLNNIIPAHAVESLKTNTKYSENHKLTAVMFASITNWLARKGTTIGGKSVTHF